MIGTEDQAHGLPLFSRNGRPPEFCDGRIGSQLYQVTAVSAIRRKSFFQRPRRRSEGVPHRRAGSGAGYTGSFRLSTSSLISVMSSMA